MSDADDDSILACALATGADRIISGDDDLLTLKYFQGIPITAPAQAPAPALRIIEGK